MHPPYSSGLEPSEYDPFWSLQSFFNGVDLILSLVTIFCPRIIVYSDKNMVLSDK